MKFQTIELLTRNSNKNRLASLLPIIAFAITTFISVFTSVLSYNIWHAANGRADYQVLAIVLVAFMLVPVFSLTSQTAKLNRKQQQVSLASLGIIGATRNKLLIIVSYQTLKTALNGLIIGTALAIAISPILSLLSINNKRLKGIYNMPIWLPILLCITILIIALINSFLEAMPVIKRPLENRLSAINQNARIIRLIFGAIIVISCLLIFHFMSLSWGVFGITFALISILLALHGFMGIIGPYILSLLTRLTVKKEQDITKLVAKRRILESPQSAWRQVSIVALMSFTTVIIGSVLGFLSAVRKDSRSNINTAQIQFFTDIRTVTVFLLCITFIALASSVNILQLIDIVDRKDLYYNLSLVGTPTIQIQKIRQKALTMPLLLAVFGGCIVAGLLVLPAFVTALLISPTFVVLMLITLLSGIALVLLAVKATYPVLLAEI
ncbi:MAG: hypothetical protein QM613_06685 [Micrococcaceae bacterium]